MSERDRHPLEYEGPLVIEALEQSFALAAAITTIAAAHARLWRIADDPRAPEALRAACNEATDAIAAAECEPIVAATCAIGRAAAEWFAGTGGKIDLSMYGHVFGPGPEETEKDDPPEG